jgi:hypothetical protein
LYLLSKPVLYLCERLDLEEAIGSRIHLWLLKISSRGLSGIRRGSLIAFEISNG